MPEDNEGRIRGPFTATQVSQTDTTHWVTTTEPPPLVEIAENYVEPSHTPIRLMVGLLESLDRE